MAAAWLRGYLRTATTSIDDFLYDHKNGFNPILDLDLTFGVVRPAIICKFPRKWWYREVEGSFLSPFHDHYYYSSSSGVL